MSARLEDWHDYLRSLANLMPDDERITVGDDQIYSLLGDAHFAADAGDISRAAYCAYDAGLLIALQELHAYALATGRPVP